MKKNKSFTAKMIEQAFKINLSATSEKAANAFGNGLFACFIVIIVFYFSGLKDRFIDPKLTTYEFFLELSLWLLLLLTAVFCVHFLVSKCHPWFHKAISKYEKTTTIIVGLIGLSLLGGIGYILADTFASKIFGDKEPSSVSAEKSDLNSPTTRLTQAISKGKPSPSETEMSKVKSLQDSGQFASMTEEELNGWLVDNGLESFDSKHIKKIMTDVFDSVSLDFEKKKRIEDWNAFFSELEVIADEKPSYVGIKLTQAVRGMSSFENLVEILERGYSFNGSHASMFATKLNTEQLKILDNYGVDFSALSADGRNSLAASIINPDKTVFDYFLSKDDLVFSQKLDVFQSVLESTSFFGRDISYAKKMIDIGVPVSDSTKTWIETELKQNDHKLYKEIKKELGL